MAVKHINEVLKEINDDPSLLHSTYKKQGDGSPLEKIFQYAFLPEQKFILPDGEPPFKKEAAPIGMTPANFIQEIRKFYIFCRKDLSSAKRETLFIQLLEGIHPEEAKILIAIKDQNLSKLYPNITRKVLADAGYLPPLTPEEAKEAVKKPKKPARSRKRTAPPDSQESQQVQ